MKKRYTAPEAEMFYPDRRDIITLSDIDNVYNEVYDGGTVDWGSDGLF